VSNAKLIELLDTEPWKDLPDKAIADRLRNETVEVVREVWSEPELLGTEKVAIPLAEHLGLTGIDEGHVAHARLRKAFIAVNGKGFRDRKKRDEHGHAT